MRVTKTFISAAEHSLVSREGSHIHKYLEYTTMSKFITGVVTWDHENINKREINCQWLGIRTTERRLVCMKPLNGNKMSARHIRYIVGK